MRFERVWDNLSGIFRERCQQKAGLSAMYLDRRSEAEHIGNSYRRIYGRPERKMILGKIRSGGHH